MEILILLSPLKNQCKTERAGFILSCLCHAICLILLCLLLLLSKDNRRRFSANRHFGIRKIKLASLMTAVVLSQSEIVAELLAIQAERRRFDERETELLTLLQNPQNGTKKPVLLRFGKNVITWEGGALAIGGKGYKFVKALYEADGMELDIEALEEFVWQNDVEEKGKVIRQNTFRVALLRLSEKLERAKFPYKLLPERSKEKNEIVVREVGKKPITKRIQSEIIGARLGVTVNCTNVTANW